MAVLLLYLSLALSSWPHCLPAPAGAHTQQEGQEDTRTLLTKEWVLRERLVLQEGEIMPVPPADSMWLVFNPDSTYRLIRQNMTPNAIYGKEVVETGRWELEPDRGLVSVQVTGVDGLSILSAMLYRWEIKELSARQLVLQQYGAGTEYLVFSRRD
ncbi:MAG: hypothetical protein LPK07_00635 [Hymenobacteraceae bacterium]|nr:hypothetical protein [Hymenobacteraceae bacterium]